jgi:hypothetical protein
MKKLLLPIMLCLTGLSSLNAQITITKNDMPSVKDTIRYSVVAPVLSGIDVNNTGTNQNWDFTGLKMISQGVYEYRSALTTPYIFQFFGAMGLKIADTLGFGSMSITKVYAFYQNNSNNYIQKGYGFSIVIPGTSIPLPLKGEYTKSDHIFNFPLDYDDSTSNDFNLVIPVGTPPFQLGEFIRSGTRTTVVDGWGKISTPYDSDIDCIRVKSVYDSRDSMAITTPPLNIGIPTKTIEYKWLSNTEKIPILEVIGTEVANNFVIQSIRFRDNFRTNDPNSLSDLTKAGYLVYPNPAADVLNIKTPNGASDLIEVVNSMGQVLVSGYPSENSLIVNTDEFSNGVYFVRVRNAYSKFIISK